MAGASMQVAPLAVREVGSSGDAQERLDAALHVSSERIAVVTGGEVLAVAEAGPSQVCAHPACPAQRRPKAWAKLLRARSDRRAVLALVAQVTNAPRVAALQLWQVSSSLYMLRTGAPAGGGSNGTVRALSLRPLDKGGEEGLARLHAALGGGGGGATASGPANNGAGGSSAARGGGEQPGQLGKNYFDQKTDAGSADLYFHYYGAHPLAWPQCNAPHLWSMHVSVSFAPLFASGCKQSLGWKRRRKGLQAHGGKVATPVPTPAPVPSILPPRLEPAPPPCPHPARCRHAAAPAEHAAGLHPDGDIPRGHHREPC